MFGLFSWKKVLAWIFLGPVGALLFFTQFGGLVGQWLLRISLTALGISVPAFGVGWGHFTNVLSLANLFVDMPIMITLALGALAVELTFMGLGMYLRIVKWITDVAPTAG